LGKLDVNTLKNDDGTLGSIPPSETAIQLYRPAPPAPPVTRPHHDTPGQQPEPPRHGDVEWTPEDKETEKRVFNAVFTRRPRRHSRVECDKYPSPPSPVTHGDNDDSAQAYEPPLDLDAYDEPNGKNTETLLFKISFTNSWSAVEVYRSPSSPYPVTRFRNDNRSPLPKPLQEMDLGPNGRRMTKRRNQTGRNLNRSARLQDLLQKIFLVDPFLEINTNNLTARMISSSPIISPTPIISPYSVISAPQTITSKPPFVNPTSPPRPPTARPTVQPPATPTGPAVLTCENYLLQIHTTPGPHTEGSAEYWAAMLLHLSDPNRGIPLGGAARIMARSRSREDVEGYILRQMNKAYQAAKTPLKVTPKKKRSPPREPTFYGGSGGSPPSPLPAKPTSTVGITHNHYLPPKPLCSEPAMPPSPVEGSSAWYGAMLQARVERPDVFKGDERFERDWKAPLRRFAKIMADSGHSREDVESYIMDQKNKAYEAERRLSGLTDEELYGLPSTPTAGDGGGGGGGPPPSPPPPSPPPSPAPSPAPLSNKFSKEYYASQEYMDSIVFVDSNDDDLLGDCDESETVPEYVITSEPEPADEPADDTVDELVVEPEDQPADEPKDEPEDEPTNEPAETFGADVIAELIAEPVAETAPDDEITSEPDSGPVSQPIQQSITEAVSKPATEPVEEAVNEVIDEEVKESIDQDETKDKDSNDDDKQDNKDNDETDDDDEDTPPPGPPPGGSGEVLTMIPADQGPPAVLPEVNPKNRVTPSPITAPNKNKATAEASPPSSRKRLRAPTATTPPSSIPKRRRQDQPILLVATRKKSERKINDALKERILDEIRTAPFQTTPFVSNSGFSMVYPAPQIPPANNPFNSHGVPHPPLDDEMGDAPPISSSVSSLISSPDPNAMDVDNAFLHPSFAGPAEDVDMDRSPTPSAAGSDVDMNGPLTSHLDTAGPNVEMLNAENISGALNPAQQAQMELQAQQKEYNRQQAAAQAQMDVELQRQRDEQIRQQAATQQREEQELINQLVERENKKVDNDLIAKRKREREEYERKKKENAAKARAAAMSSGLQAASGPATPGPATLGPATPGPATPGAGATHGTPGTPGAQASRGTISRPSGPANPFMTPKKRVSKAPGSAPGSQNSSAEKHADASTTRPNGAPGRTLGPRLEVDSQPPGSSNSPYNPTPTGGPPHLRKTPVNPVNQVIPVGAVTPRIRGTRSRTTSLSDRRGPGLRIDLPPQTPPRVPS
jgi:hypothetical protein